MNALIHLIQGFVALVMSVAIASTAYADTAQQIVAQTDRVRNPDQPFRMVMTLTEYLSGHEHNQDTLVVFAKTDPATRQYRNLVEYTEPARDAGKRVLFGGGALWFYDPASKQSVRISPQQRLVGQAAIGDVLTVNLAVDYTATLVGEESIEDAGHQTRQCWHLDLKAANDQSTYGRIEYWVEKGSFYPIKGKLYSDSGRLLKVAYYRDFADRLGAKRPTQIVIIDAVDTSLATIVTLGDWQFHDVPDLWFQRDYLPRLDAK